MERIVLAAMSAVPQEANRRRLAPRAARRGRRPLLAFSLVATGLVGVVVAGVWFSTRVPRQVVPEPRPNEVVSITADDGAILIISTGRRDDWPPPGTAIVMGGGGEQ